MDPTLFCPSEAKEVMLHTSISNPSISGDTKPKANESENDCFSIKWYAHHLLQPRKDHYGKMMRKVFFINGRTVNLKTQPEV
jgi:hypothetical protein